MEEIFVKTDTPAERPGKVYKLTSRRTINDTHINCCSSGFQGSTIEEKRNLINFVFANLELKPGKLEYTLRPPFDVFVNLGKNEEWWR